MLIDFRLIRTVVALTVFLSVANAQGPPTVYPTGDALVGANSPTPQASQAVVYADAFIGLTTTCATTDPFAAVTCAINALSSAGGRVIATNLGSGAISSSLVISASGVTVEWGSATYDMGLTNTITISGSNDEFLCTKSGLTGTIFQSTTNTGSGTPGNLLGSIITVGTTGTGASTNNVRLRGCSVQGNRISSGDKYDGANCIFATQVANGLLIEDMNLTNCGGNGISLINSDNWVLQRNYIAQTSAPGINVNSTINSTVSGGAYLGQKVIRDNQIYDAVTSVSDPCVAAGTCTTLPTGNYQLNINSNLSYGANANLEIVNNIVQNGYVNPAVNPYPCNPNYWKTSNASGCTGGIQLNQVTNYEVGGNTVSNTQAECVAVGYSTGRIHHNNLSECHVLYNTSSMTFSIPNNGSGGISYYVTNNNGAIPLAPPQGNSEIDNNIVTDAGYVIQVVLGNNTTLDGIVVQDLNVHDNQGNLGALYATLLDGILVQNNSDTNATYYCMTGATHRKCNWTIKNSSFANNDMRLATTPFLIADTTHLTNTNGWMVAGPAGWYGSTTPTAQSMFESDAGYTGVMTFKPNADSIAAYQFQNNSGTNEVTIDTTNNRVGVATGMADPGDTFSVAENFNVNGASGKITRYAGISTQGNGVPSEVYQSSLVGLNSSIGTTTIYTTPTGSATIYDFSFYVAQVSAGTSCINSGTVQVKLIYSDAASGSSYSVIVPLTQNNATSFSTTMPLSNSAPTVANSASGSYHFAATAGSNVQINVPYTAGSGCITLLPTYNLYGVLRAL